MNQLAVNVMRIVIDALRAEASERDLLLTLLQTSAVALFRHEPELAGVIDSALALVRVRR